MSCEEELIELKKINQKLNKTNQQLEQKLLELYTLYSISRELSDAVELEEMLNNTMHIMKDTLGIDGFVIYLRDDLTDFYILQSVYGIDPEQIENIRISTDEEFIGEIEKNGYLISNTHKQKIPIFSDKVKIDGKVLFLPFGSSEMIGFIGILKYDGDFEEYESDLFKNMSQQLASAIEKLRYQKKVQDMIIIDPETGLYNRKFFFEALKREWERARRYKRFTSVMLIKIDRFNEFFGKHGSRLTELLVKTIAHKVSANVRFSDILARFGIDEFGIILPETNITQAKKAAEKILNILSQTTFMGEKELEKEKITFSIGIAAYPVSGEEPLKILNSAIEAMKLAQSQGGDKIITA